MLLTVIDGNGAKQVVTAQAQGTPTDRSGTVAVANTSQQLMAANTSRAGWFIQNTTLNQTITVNDLGQSATGTNSVVLNYGDVFPPPGYPVSTGAINVAGPFEGATFVAREW